ncbi:MAG: PHP domain-containing protein [Thiohalomonadaceae bacterium]
MSYDLHSHSWISDGTLSPTALVQRAAAAGVTVLALTDHDDTAGHAEARLAAEASGIEILAGVEVSVTWQGMTIHVVGLNIDPADIPLQTGLARLRDFRNWRAEEMGRRLAQRGIAGAHAGALALSRGRVISRTHFAHFLVSQGCGKTVRDIFKHYIKPNKPGYVPGQWAALEEAVGWIRGAGGVAVMAHPARYPLTTSKLRRLLVEFMEYGGEAMEVVSGSHGPDDVQAMARHARGLGLLASAGSDFHGPEHAWLELGQLAALPEGLTPVWQAWEDKYELGQPKAVGSHG